MISVVVCCSLFLARSGIGGAGALHPGGTGMIDEPSTRYICVKCGYRDRCEITQYGEGHENPPLRSCLHGLLDDVDQDQERAVWEVMS